MRPDPRPARSQRDRATVKRSCSPPQGDPDGRDENGEEDRGGFRRHSQRDQEQPARGAPTQSDRGENMEPMSPQSIAIRGIRRVDDQSRRHYAVPSHCLMQIAPPNRSSLAPLRAGQTIFGSLFEGHEEKGRTGRFAMPVLHTKHIQTRLTAFSWCPPVRAVEAGPRRFSTRRRLRWRGRSRSLARTPSDPRRRGGTPRP